MSPTLTSNGFPAYPRAAAWLAVHQVVRIVNSSSSSMSDRVEVNAQSPRWVPAWLARYAISAYFGHISPARASTHRMDRLTRSKPTVAGTVKWQARFSSAPGRTVWTLK